MFVVRMLVNALLILVFTFGITVVPAFSHSVAGETLSKAQEDDFFTFFHFKESGSEKEPNHDTIVGFGTAMGKYSTQLAVILDAQQCVRDLTLVLERSFIDDPHYGVFARDLAKSFLHAAIPDVDQSAIQTLANEIAFGNQDVKPFKAAKVVNQSTGETTRGTTLLIPGNASKPKKGDAVWMGPGNVPELPSQPTSGYLTYLGKQDTFQASYSKSRIRINNTEKNGQKLLMLTVWTTAK